MANANNAPTVTTVVATLIAAVMAVLAMLSAAVGAFLLRNQRSASQLRIANEELAVSHAHLQSILETVAGRDGGH